MEDHFITVAPRPAARSSARTEAADRYTVNPKKFVQDLALKHRRQVGRRWIPSDRIWILYDPSITTKWKDDATASRFQEFLRSRHEEERIQAREKRHANAARRKKLVETYSQGQFGILLDRIADLFAAGLLNELSVAHQVMSLELLQNELDGWDILEDYKKPSSLGGLYAKWTPTPGGMHDKALGMASLIREKLLEKLKEENNRPLMEKIVGSSAHHNQNAPLQLEHLSLQRDVLTMLRKLAGVPEHHIGAGTLKGGVDYRRMSSRCRLIFGEKLFRRYDEENYDKYLIDAAKAMMLKMIQKSDDEKNSKVAVGALAPHEVMLSAVKASKTHSVYQKVEAALQWKALIDSCARPVAKDNSNAKRLIIPMCDVSGSMTCLCENGSNGTATCMDVACALSLLLTDSLPIDNAFYGKILTFSENPQFVDVAQEKRSDLTVKAIADANSLADVEAWLPDLSERVRRLKQSDWGRSTHFFRAMERICDIALQNEMTACNLQGLELVVFSDMEFNEAQYGYDEDSSQKTMMDKIQKLFIHRFGSEVAPKIVFWNLRASPSGSGVVEDAMEDGVALLSGFSSGLIRKYLNWDLGIESRENQTKSDMNPTKAMLACLVDPMYQSLKLEKDLDEWEVLVSEEEIMRRAEFIRGENNELVHRSNSSALVALFFEAVPGIGIDELGELLDAAFKENPKIALKLLFNLGTVRKHAGGKADRQNFQIGLLWLWRNWPDTYLLNVTAIAKFASLKELLNSAMFILYEDKNQRDPDDYELFSLEGQKDALTKHLQRKNYRQNAKRRKIKKENRLELWSDFARCEGKNLFGDLRIELKWEQIKKKLGDLTELEFKRIRYSNVELNAELFEISCEMKDRLAETRAMKFARRRGKNKTTKLATERKSKEKCYIPFYDD